MTDPLGKRLAEYQNRNLCRSLHHNLVPDFGLKLQEDLTQSLYTPLWNIFRWEFRQSVQTERSTR